MSLTESVRVLRSRTIQVVPALIAVTVTDVLVGERSRAMLGTEALQEYVLARLRRSRVSAAMVITREAPTVNESDWSFKLANCLPTSPVGDNGERSVQALSS